MHPLLDKLTGGDRRSIGRANVVAREVLRNPRLFGVLVEGMLAPDPLVRMRAADAAEKITVERPELLAPHKVKLLGEVSQVDQQEVRWHLALMLPRLELNARERRQALEILRRRLADSSRIVQVCAMQGLADLAESDPTLRAEAIGTIERLVQAGSPAVKSRGARLLKRLKRKD